MTQKHNLNSTTAANATVWADDVDDTVNRLSGLVLGRLTNVAGTNALSGRLPMSAGFTAISDGAQLSFVAVADNNGAMTMQLKDTSGADVGSSFALRDSLGVALAAGAVQTGGLYRFEYSASDVYARMLAPVGSKASGVPNALVYEKQNSGVAGSNATSGAWETRVLNTEYDPDSVISIASNEFTPVFDGWIKAWAHVWDVNDAKARLYNVTDTSAVDPIGMVSSNAGGADAADYIYITAPVEAGKAYRIETRVSSTKTAGYGHPVGFGDEIYLMVEYYIAP